VCARVKPYNQFLVNHRHLIPYDGERYRHGEPIATGFVESTGNEEVRKQCCKQQHMQWAKAGGIRTWM